MRPFQNKLDLIDSFIKVFDTLSMDIKIKIVKSHPDLGDKIKIVEVLKKLLNHPNICSKKWIWEQYDHTVMCDTVQKPGGDSAVVRIHSKDKAVSMTVDSSSNY